MCDARVCSCRCMCDACVRCEYASHGNSDFSTRFNNFKGRHQHLSMSRPASAQVPEMSEGAKAMWDRLEFVSIQDMQAAMVKANVPGADATVWKVDLINLAIQHGFNYVVPRMRLTKAAAPLAAIPHQPPPTVAAAPFAAIPLQPPPASRDAPPAPSALLCSPSNQLSNVVSWSHGGQVMTVQRLRMHAARVHCTADIMSACVFLIQGKKNNKNCPHCYALLATSSRTWCRGRTEAK